MFERKEEKALQILFACRKPQRFSELEKYMSARGLTDALKRFINRGWIKKTKDGKYVLTEKGKEVLDLILFQESVEVLGVRDREIQNVFRRIRARAGFKILYESILILFYTYGFLDRFPRVRKQIYGEFSILEECLREMGNIYAKYFKDIQPQEMFEKSEKITRELVMTWKKKRKVTKILLGKKEELSKEYILEDLIPSIENRLELVDPSVFPSEIQSFVEKTVLLIYRILDKISKNLS